MHINQIPYLESITVYYYNLIESISSWIGKNIFFIEETIKNNRSGSGDTLYNYVQFYSFLLLSLVLTTVIQSIIYFNKLKWNYVKIQYWFFVYLRLYLFTVLLSYGLAKVFPLQFRSPDYFRLLTNFGDFSPMGLEWTYMGYSRGYTFLAGLIEVIGALFLLHIRTVKLGSIIILGVMFNVIAVNIFYDVPVKLYAIRYFVIAFILILPDFKRILFVLLDFPVKEKIEKYVPFTGKKNIVLLICKWLIILVYTGNSLSFFIKRDFSEQKPINKGLYKVTDFFRNGQNIPPLITDSTRIRYFAVERYNNIGIMNMLKQKSYYRVQLDTLKKLYTLQSFRDSLDVYKLTYHKKNDSLYFEGTHKNDSIKIKTVKLEKTDFNLYQRPFTWVSEIPFNR